MKPFRHFILRHEGELDPCQLRQMIAGQEPSYAGCDVHDLRDYPSDPSDGRLTVRQALVSLIRLRHASSDWIPNRKAVVVLSPDSDEDLEVPFAALRSKGVLAIVVSGGEADDARARALASHMNLAEIQELPATIKPPLPRRRSLRETLQRKIRII